MMEAGDMDIQILDDDVLNLVAFFGSTFSHMLGHEALEESSLSAWRSFSSIIRYVCITSFFHSCRPVGALLPSYHVGSIMDPSTRIV